MLHPDTHNCGGMLPLADDIKAPAEAERGSSTLLGTAALAPSAAGSGIQTQAESTRALAAGTPSQKDGGQFACWSPLLIYDSLPHSPDLIQGLT